MNLSGKKKSWWAIITCLLLFSSCEEKGSFGLGSEDVAPIEFSSADINVSSSVVLLDSIRSSGVGTLLVGRLQDENFGEFWKLIHDEFLLTRHWVLYLSGFDSLMDNLPAGKASIALRESIVLPLLTIQQYALIKLRNIDGEGDLLNTERSNYENMVTRSMIGNTNASRNSA